MNNLFIELRVHFDPQTNQDTLHEVAESLKDRLYDLASDEEAPTVLQFKDVTYQVVMVVNPKEA